MVSALGASWGSLGTFLAHLVGLLVALGASLGVSWDLLGLLGRLLVPLGASLGPCWGLLVVLGASLGASWDLLGLLGRRLVPLGASAHTVPQTSRLQDLLLLSAWPGIRGHLACLGVQGAPLYPNHMLSHASLARVG